MSREYAKKLLAHYIGMSTILDRDCKEEIGEIIDSVIDNTKEELRTEVVPMVQLSLDMYNEMMEDLEEKRKILAALKSCVTFTAKAIGDEEGYDYRGELKISRTGIEKLLTATFCWADEYDRDSDGASEMIVKWDFCTGCPRDDCATCTLELMLERISK